MNNYRYEILQKIKLEDPQLEAKITDVPTLEFIQTNGVAYSILETISRVEMRNKLGKINLGGKLK